MLAGSRIAATDVEGYVGQDKAEKAQKERSSKPARMRQKSNHAIGAPSFSPYRAFAFFLRLFAGYLSKLRFSRYLLTDYPRHSGQLLFSVADFLHNVIRAVFYGVEDLSNVFAQDPDNEKVHASKCDNAKQQTGPTWRQIHSQNEVPENGQEQIKEKRQRRANPDDVGESQRRAGKAGNAIDSEP